MCFPTPIAAVTPQNPAPYPLDQAYAGVKSSTTTPDGVTHGGDTIANQYAAENAAKAKTTPTTPFTQAPATTGSNFRM